MIQPPDRIGRGEVWLFAKPNAIVMYEQPGGTPIVNIGASSLARRDRPAGKAKANFNLD